ncbi:hypothetical protein O181_019341 [Austropuccinia psidii MF-1]|uniref:Uncharacterized protein n=1 Tax=Austropuccinia psidii MF-1 TaxID=1389203 RepID=A0A9Q3C6Z3_9BASI|nr:hypothetical protein [Austropuccinia psidii MF-1]
MLKLGDTPILWGSKQQTVVALLTCAAEPSTGNKSTDTTGSRLQEDNLLRQSSSSSGLDQQLISQTHAVPRPCLFFVNDIMVRWVNTREMQADALTKRLSGQSLNQALHFIGITGNR